MSDGTGLDFGRTWAVDIAGELATMSPGSNTGLVRCDMWTFYRLDNKRRRAPIHRFFKSLCSYVPKAVRLGEGGQQVRLLDLSGRHQQNFFDTHVKPYLFDSLLKPRS